jgi:hypothetical protein
MHPLLVNKLLPNEEDIEYKECIPCQICFNFQYIEQRKEFSDRVGDPEIIEAFNKFSMDIKTKEKIEKRNRDPKQRTRFNAGIAYEL